VSAVAPSPAPASAKATFLAISLLVIATLSFAVSHFGARPEVSPNPELGPGSSGASYRTGQAVEIWQNNRWLPGKIQAVGDGRYFIFYDGFSVSWNEWVGPDRLRPVPADF
jgi:hypothetical protein